MIPTNELKDMREAVEALFPDTCSILTPTSAADGQGGVTVTWGTVTGIKCRMDHKNGSEGLVGASRQAFTGYVLSVPYDTVILEAYRVGYGGDTYAVVDINSDQSWPIVKRVQLERV